jgi:cobalt-zinc-cadmium efflux system outer membrane protein
MFFLVRAERRVLRFAVGVCLSGAAAVAVAAGPGYTLDALLERALRESPALATSRAQLGGAQAGLITARALPNPELGLDPGSLSPRRVGDPSGSSVALSVTQPIENPRLRAARLDGARARVEVARAETSVLQSQLSAAIRDRFFELVRLRAELQAQQEDLLLTEQIRDRIDVRVRAGEAPRFDALRAEGEVAGVRRLLEATRLRLREAQFGMRQLVSPLLEAEFEVVVRETDTRLLAEADYLTLRQAIFERNPEVLLARDRQVAAQRQVELERNRIVPQVSLRATHERDPAVTLNRIGAQLTVPLLDRREGPIAEAQAEAERSRLALEQRRFEVEAAFDASWQAYRSALSQVQAIEGGTLDRARQVLGIAEAAYRLGERGILEFLDAQRQFRLVRNDLITARFLLQRARTDLERLAGR